MHVNSSLVVFMLADFSPDSHISYISGEAYVLINLDKCHSYLSLVRIFAPTLLSIFLALHVVFLSFNALMHILFFLPEPQAQVIFSDQNLSVVVGIVNFSHFHLLLHYHWTTFNQTWHKALKD